MGCTAHDRDIYLHISLLKTPSLGFPQTPSSIPHSWPLLARGQARDINPGASSFYHGHFSCASVSCKVPESVCVGS